MVIGGHTVTYRDRAIYLYNAMVLPIATYGAEIWLPLKIKAVLKNNTSLAALFLDTPHHMLDEEINRMAYLKRIIWLPLSTPTAAVMADTGVTPPLSGETVALLCQSFAE